MKLFKLNTITALLAALILFSGCEGFLDVNEDPNSPTQAPEDLQLSAVQGVFSYEILAGRGPRATSQWIQQTAWNGVQPSFDTYEVLPVDANPVWTNSYTEVMNNAWEMIELAEQNGNYDYAGIGRIMIAWNLGIVTDTFGDVPYSQAWNVVEYPAPAFDSQEDVYNAIFSLLRQGIDNIEQGGPVSPGNDDLLYGGDMEKWMRLAHSLKARYHMHLTAAPGYSATAMADSALAALQNGLQSNADNANFQYYDSDGSENPWFQFAIKNSWDTRNQMSQQYIQLLKDVVYNEPGDLWDYILGRIQVR